MKHQVLFSLKDKRQRKIKASSAAVFKGPTFKAPKRQMKKMYVCKFKKTTAYVQAISHSNFRP